MIGFVELEPFLDRKRQDLFMALSEFSAKGAISQRESEGGWTPRDIVEHLSLVERSVIDQLVSMLSSEPPRPAEPFPDKTVDITEPFRERGLLGTKKKTTPEMEPSGLISYEQAMKQLEDIRLQLKDMVPLLAARETNSLIALHPLGIPLNACQWVLFSAFHEWGHIQQLKRIRAANP